MQEPVGSPQPIQAAQFVVNMAPVPVQATQAERAGPGVAGSPASLQDKPAVTGEVREIQGTQFVRTRLPDGVETWLPVGAKVVNDANGGYHIDYPNGQTVNAGKPNANTESVAGQLVVVVGNAVAGAVAGEIDTVFRAGEAIGKGIYNIVKAPFDESAKLGDHWGFMYSFDLAQAHDDRVAKQTGIINDMMNNPLSNRNFVSEWQHSQRLTSDEVRLVQGAAMMPITIAETLAHVTNCVLIAVGAGQLVGASLESLGGIMASRGMTAGDIIASEAPGARSGLFNRAAENVNRYWGEYYSAVGEQGDSLAATVARLRELGFEVEAGENAAFVNGTIKYGPNTKIWELYEEATHYGVQQGLGVDEIAALTQELRREFWQRGIRAGSPAATAEEIFVKQQLLMRLDLDAATRTILEQQIQQLRTRGMSGGY